MLVKIDAFFFVDNSESMCLRASHSAVAASQVPPEWSTNACRKESKNEKKKKIEKQKSTQQVFAGQNSGGCYGVGVLTDEFVIRGGLGLIG